MNAEQLSAYIEQRVHELKAKKDFGQMFYRKRFSFGISSADCGHLPTWKELAIQKTSFLQNIWISAFFESVLMVVVLTDVIERFEQNWLKALAFLLLMSGVVLLLFMLGFVYSLFIRQHQMERLVRILLYEDLLCKIKKEENVMV